MNAGEVNRSPLDVTPARLSKSNATQHRLEYDRLFARYKTLAWCTSATDQRERAALQQPLMELYRVLNPGTVCAHLDDDFETVIRARRRA